jgi:hypothetical protein
MNSLNPRFGESNSDPIRRSVREACFEMIEMIDRSSEESKVDNNLIQQELERCLDSMDELSEELKRIDWKHQGSDRKMALGKASINHSDSEKKMNNFEKIMTLDLRNQTKRALKAFEGLGKLTLQNLNDDSGDVKKITELFQTTLNRIHNHVSEKLDNYSYPVDSTRPAYSKTIDFVSEKCQETKLNLQNHINHHRRRMTALKVTLRDASDMSENPQKDQVSATDGLETSYKRLEGEVKELLNHELCLKNYVDFQSQSEAPRDVEDKDSELLIDKFREKSRNKMESVVDRFKSFSKKAVKDGADPEDLTEIYELISDDLKEFRPSMPGAREDIDEAFGLGSEGESFEEEITPEPIAREMDDSAKADPVPNLKE